MTLNEREAIVAQIEEFKKDAMELWFVPELAASYKNMDMFSYSIVENNEIFFMREQARQLWSFWNKAKAQAVPKVPVLTFGYGDIDVMEGIYQGSYSLMLGKNGGGVVGGDNQANRIAEDDELHVVFKFHNEKSIRVVIDRLLRLHKRLCNKEPVEIKDANGEVIQTIYASESGAEG